MGEFLEGTVPLLRAALEAEEPALVAISQRQTALLEGELGADAAEVRFADMETLGRNPARIIPFWQDFLDAHRGRPVLGIGEPMWAGRERHEIDECQRHESLLNVAFAGQAAWLLLCPYDACALSDDVLSRVADSHQHVAREGVVECCGIKYPNGHDCLAGELPGRPPVMDDFGFTRDGLAHVRGRVARVAALTGMPRDRLEDLVAAANELAANSVTHGGGTGVLRVWRDNGRFVVEVEDSGRIEEQLVGRVRPTEIQQGGRGLWLANQLCDLVQIRSDTRGTTVRLHTEVS